MLSFIFRALRLGGVLTSPQAAPSGLQMTPPSHRGMESPRKPGSPDFILISSCDLDWCRFKQTVCVDLRAPFAHVGFITERYMGVMNTWFKWKILCNESILRVVCA